MNCLKRLVFLWILGVELICLANAQATTPIQGLIWKAMKGDFAIYLAGVAGIDRKDIYPLPKPFEDAFNQATDIVEVEYIAPGTEPSKALVSVLKGMKYPEGDSVANHVSPETLTLLKKYVTDKKLDLKLLYGLKPWAIAFSLQFLEDLANPPKKSSVPGIEEYFTQKALQARKTIVGVVPPPIQVTLLSELSPRVQEEFLVGTIKAYLLTGNPQDPDPFPDLQKYWLAGDADGFAASHEKLLSRLPADFAQITIFDRSARIAEAAERYAKYKKPCLFVVGVAYLLGPKGVHQLLKDEGFTVSQMKSPEPAKG